MHSFLFPEDIGSLSASLPRIPQESGFEITNTKSPPMPSRAPPGVPQQNTSRTHVPPPQPSYAPPPPPPCQKDKPTISITELNTPNHRPEPHLKRKKTTRSYRQLISLSQSNDQTVSRADKTSSRVEVHLPPLSPVVDEEFWRTGRYPSSPQGGFAMAHVPF